jgi:hypothetical protein
LLDARGLLPFFFSRSASLQTLLSTKAALYGSGRHGGSQIAFARPEPHGGASGRLLSLSGWLPILTIAKVLLFTAPAERGLYKMHLHHHVVCLPPQLWGGESKADM